MEVAGTLAAEIAPVVHHTCQCTSVAKETTFREDTLLEFMSQGPNGLFGVSFIHRCSIIDLQYGVLVHQ